MITTAQGTSVPAIFNFESNKVRIVDIHGQPWFVAKDVCDILGYTHTPHAVRILDTDEKGVQKVDTQGGAQRLTIVNESGLYALVLRSRKPEARKFAKWVTSEVLPEIRKTGRYEEVKRSPEPLEDGQYLLTIKNGKFFDKVYYGDGTPPRPSAERLSSEPTYYRECRDVLFQFADSLPPGTQWPADEEKRQRIADGYLTDILTGRRWLMGFDHQGRMQMSPVPPSARVVAPGEIPAMIRESMVVGEDDVLEILRACADRLAKVRS